jgi:hypothetical protein
MTSDIMRGKKAGVELQRAFVDLCQKGLKPGAPLLGSNLAAEHIDDLTVLAQPFEQQAPWVSTGNRIPVACRIHLNPT